MGLVVVMAGAHASKVDSPNTSEADGMPPQTRYHRWVGWHAPALRRAIIVLGSGVAVALVLLGLVTWELGVIEGWDAAAVAFLATVWPIIFRADSVQARVGRARGREARCRHRLAHRGDLASLTGVVFALGLAGRQVAHSGCS